MLRGESTLALPSSLHDRRYQKLSRLLRKARQDAGLTQEEAAARLGRPQSWVSRCENRQRRIDVVELEDLAKLYRKPLKFFFGR